jgi:glyoxylase-like metal-dependent hydrolase (beta-lactamase superfamily II)
VTEVAAGISVVLAPNPGPMTLDGTNTWILGRPGGPSVVVDPGPADEGHLQQVRTVAGSVVDVVVTHRHLDHTEGSARFAALTGSGVRAADPAYAIAAVEAATGDRPGSPLSGGRLEDGTELAVGDLTIRAIATPGHTSDSTSLLVTGPDGCRLLTGDTVLGRGTTVITHPDGDLAAYLDSLEVLRRVVHEHGVIAILPGHGPVVDDPEGVLRHYREHRHQRLDQVREALRQGDRTPAEVVARVYADVHRSVWPAAEQSVRAQLDYLHHHP